MLNDFIIYLDLSKKELNSSAKIINYITSILVNLDSISKKIAVENNHVMKFYSDFGGIEQLLFFLKENLSIDISGIEHLSSISIADKETNISDEEINKFIEFLDKNNLEFPLKNNINLNIVIKKRNSLWKDLKNFFRTIKFSTQRQAIK